MKRKEKSTLLLMAVLVFFAAVVFSGCAKAPSESDIESIGVTGAGTTSANTTYYKTDSGEAGKDSWEANNGNKIVWCSCCNTWQIQTSGGGCGSIYTNTLGTGNTPHRNRMGRNKSPNTKLLTDLSKFS